MSDGNRVLTRAEVVEVTGYKRWTSQKKALEVMGIAYRLRPDGCPVVTASALDENGPTNGAEPNFSALDEAKG